MHKSNGRPRLGSAKRDNYVKVGFNDMEHDRIEILSAKAGMNKAVIGNFVSTKIGKVKST